MNIIKKLFCKILKIECCHQCESMKFEKGYWSRGWNHYCNQAYGDKGKRCFDCGYIQWDTSIIEHLQTLPTWCEPYQQNYDK